MLEHKEDRPKMKQIALRELKIGDRFFMYGILDQERKILSIDNGIYNSESLAPKPSEVTMDMRGNVMVWVIDKQKPSGKSTLTF